MTWIKLILVLSLLSVLCYTTEKALQLESSLSFLVIPQWAAMRGPLSLSMPRCLPVPAIFESLYDATDPSSLNNPRFFMVICSGCHGTQMLLQDCGILIRFLKWIPITYTIINMASGRHIGIAWLVSRTATNNYLYYPLSRWLLSGVVNSFPEPEVMFQCCLVLLNNMQWYLVCHRTRQRKTSKY